MSEEDEELRQLLRRVQQGEQDALGTLFSRYRDRLQKMIEFRLDARLRGRVAASDILQESYIEALKRLPHFQSDPDVPFFIWLRTVTMQRLIDVHRHHLEAKVRDVGREVSLGPTRALGASTERMAELMGDLTTPSQAAQRDEAIVQLREVLDRLDPIDREVLALRHFEELSNREVAATLGIEAPAASKRYVRAIERLRDTLEQAPGFEKGVP